VFKGGFVIDTGLRYVFFLDYISLFNFFGFCLVSNSVTTLIRFELNR